jgi:(-)-germacrene D synthase
MKMNFRWDISCLDDLPDYMKFLYKPLLDVYEEIEQEVKKEGRVYAINHFLKEVRVLFYC